LLLLDICCDQDLFLLSYSDQIIERCKIAHDLTVFLLIYWEKIYSVPQINYASYEPLVPLSCPSLTSSCGLLFLKTCKWLFENLAPLPASCPSILIVEVNSHDVVLFDELDKP
jgi:hypothetical protein